MSSKLRPSRAPTEAREIATLLATLSNRRRDAPISVTRLQAAAEHAVGRLCERDNGARLHAILTRCDVRGETHKAVAADLGLSRRQFYRDLATARHLIAKEIRGEIVSIPRSTPALPYAAQLQTAAALAAAGHRRVAYDSFAPVTASMSSAHAVWGYCVLAEFLLQDDDPAGADRQLERARDACGQAAGVGREHLALIEASKAFEAGRMADSVRALEESVRIAEPYAQSGVALSAETYSRALTLLAFCYQARGQFHLASTTHARNPASFPDAAISQTARVDYLNVNAMLACDGPSGPAGARAACNAFYEFAAGHGFLEDISAALTQKSGIARTQRRLDEAMRLATES
ncbi:MAG: hypothetical protein JOZ01_00235, partial [Candidatus Eremiobacteraeota bacterium]|nr:hypothetical protein [Candidatus Eremiobacteraeota bacterium]